MATWEFSGTWLTVWVNLKHSNEYVCFVIEYIWYFAKIFYWIITPLVKYSSYDNKNSLPFWQRIGVSRDGFILWRTYDNRLDNQDKLMQEVEKCVLCLRSNFFYWISTRRLWKSQMPFSLTSLSFSRYYTCSV